MSPGARPRRVARTLAAVAVAAAAVRSAATELYVDAEHPAADDRNAGTARGRPLRTISAAVARAAPGDTVRIADGTYREAIAFPRSGERGRPIRVAAAPGAEVAIKGSDVVTGWAPEGEGAWKRVGWGVNSQQVFVDGRPLRQIGASSPFHARAWDGRPILPPAGRGAGDLVPGSFFYDAGTATLHVRLPDGGDPNGRAVEASVRDAVIDTAASFVELDGLRFSHSNGSARAAMTGIVNVVGDGWVISRCTFSYGDFVGLSLAGSGHRVRDSAANRNGDLGIAINGSDAAHGWAAYEGRPPQDVVLSGNETSENNTRGFYRYWQAGGVKATNGCSAIRVERHLARENDGPGIWFDLGCRDVTIEGSRLHGNTAGIVYEISDRATIAGNVVTGSAEHGIYVSASSDVAVLRNTLERNGWGIVVHGEPRREHPRLERNAVRGNVVARSARADLVLFAGPGAAGNASDGNVFYSGAAGGVRISWTRTTGYRVTHRDLAAFTADTGQDRRSSTGDPRLADPAGGGR